MIEQEISTEKLVEFGDNNFKEKEYDFAISYYKRALTRYNNQELKPSDINSVFKIYIKLADAYSYKADETKDKIFYTYAIDMYKKSLLIQPNDQVLHDKLIVVAHKTNSLDDLAIEYKEKLKKEPENVIYTQALKKIKTLSILHTEKPRIDTRYHPSLFIKITFDYILLPITLTLIGLAILKKPFRPMLLQSIALLVFYFIYRIIISRK